MNYFLITIGDELAEEVWVKAYLQILGDNPTKFVLDKLIQKEKIDQTVEVIRKLYTNYRTHREAFIWLVMHIEDYEQIKQRLPEHDKITIAMTHLYDINATDISNKRHLSANRKNQKQIQKYLYKENHLNDLIERAEESVIVQLIPILNELQKIEPAVTISQKEIIAKRFPHLAKEFDYQVSAQKSGKRSGFFTLESSYHTKQRELLHIHEVDVPENSKEIQKALELGDLRENAEYKSAKERQELLNANAMRLDNEMRRAKIMQPNAFEDKKVGFGSRIALTDLKDNKEITYTIFGPWESDPSKDIISYLSPLGERLTGHNVGTELRFSINDVDYQFRIEKIEAAALHNN